MRSSLIRIRRFASAPRREFSPEKQKEHLSLLSNLKETYLHAEQKQYELASQIISASEVRERFQHVVPSVTTLKQDVHVLEQQGVNGVEAPQVVLKESIVSGTWLVCVYMLYSIISRF